MVMMSEQGTTVSQIAQGNDSSLSDKVNNWPAISNLFEINLDDIFGVSETTPLDSVTEDEFSSAGSAPVHTTTVLNGAALVTKGSFKVEAGSQTGTWFQNLSNKSATIKFSANGRWSYENGTFYSANGHPSAKLSNGFSQGGLILYRHGNSTIEYIGQAATKKLNPMDMVYFRCNDDVFLDNMGSLTVDWELQSIE